MENKEMEVMNENEELNNIEIYDFDEGYYDEEPVSMAAVGGAVAGLGALGVLGFIAGKKLAPKVKAKVADVKAALADRKAMNAALKENKKAFVEAWKSKASIEPVTPESEPIEEPEEE